MEYHRKVAAAAGVLFIVATVSPIVSGLFIAPMRDSNYLTSVSANDGQVLTGVFLLLAMTASIVSIPIVMFPILRRQGEGLALGYVGARIFEGFFSALNIVLLLSLLSLSREFVGTADPVSSFFQTSGALLVATFDWSSLLLDFPFCVGALLFYYLLYRSRLVPRWLSAFGLVGAALWLATAPVRVFGLGAPLIDILALPIAAQEMVLAAWLIVKGFNPSLVSSRSSVHGGPSGQLPVETVRT